ncbi:MAG: WYL domain-containing protein [Eubacteriales bacterium]|nr:WYL domain-containing protein [Eubacteriales bacterium]
MAYSELIKNFNRIREYMRDFYVYGFKSRDEYTRKSARSYDNERRRVDSWLGSYMHFRRTEEGKNVFLSIDTRETRHNPFFKAWKAKSFTDGDITLHFLLMDILNTPEEAYSLSEIMEQIDEALEGFREPRLFDASTVRKKLKEYISEGIVTGEKRGKTMYYRRAGMAEVYDRDILHFFSETAPCGVIGSCLMDKEERVGEAAEHLAFKHHYITGTLDSEILCSLFQAMQEKRSVTLESANYRKKQSQTVKTWVVPLKIMVSVQNGRQYLMAYVPRIRRIMSFRTDFIRSVKYEEICENFDELRRHLEDMLPHLWGVSTQSRSGNRMEHVEFTVRYSAEEHHIHRRLEREKRCGTVEQIDKTTSRFSADVYDSSELLPWIRTFICRITEIHFSNPEVERQFREDLRELYEIYGLKGGEE